MFNLLYYLLVLSVAMSDCGTFVHNCMNYNTHWGKYVAVVQTTIGGYVKTIDLTEYRYNLTACVGSPFLVITTSYEVNVNKGEKDTESAAYIMKTKDILLHSEELAVFASKGFVSAPAMTTVPVSLKGLNLTKSGQPHLTVEKESIGKESNATLVFSGIILKGIIKSPYNRIGEDGCFDYTALIAWIIGIAVAIIIVVVIIFYIVVELKRSKSNKGGYAGYAGTGNIKQLHSSL